MVGARHPAPLCGLAGPARTLEPDSHRQRRRNMIKPIMRFSTLTLVVSLTLAGCGVFGGGTVSPNAWELGAISPDGTQLLVGTFFGADTSCSRFEGWEVNETDEWVEILAMLWNKDGPGDCNLAGMSSQVVAQLDKPLGARGIVGCGADECMAAPALSGRFRGPPVATNTVLITALQQELLGTDPLTGEVIWTLDRRHAGGQSNSFIIVDDTLWLPDPGVVTRFDASTGNAEWSTPVPLGAGMSLAVDADAVYVTSPLSLTALDRETGVELWSAALPWSGETVTAVSAEN